MSKPEVIKRKQTASAPQAQAPVQTPVQAPAPVEGKAKKTTVSKTNRKGMDMIIGTIFNSLITDENFTDKQIKNLLSKFVNFLPYTSEYRKKKSHKNPDEPKRALSPYFCFLDARRKEIIEKNPTLKFKDINKLLGSMWAELSEADRKPYNEMASKDRIRYQSQREAYLKDHPPAPKPEKKARKARAKPTESESNDQAQVQTEQAPVEKKARKSKKQSTDTTVEVSVPKTAKTTTIGAEHEIKAKVKKSKATPQPQESSTTA